MDVSEGLQLDALERLVLELYAEGLSTTEVSIRVGLPVDRVRACLADTISKLGARSKLEALIVAIRHDLIRLPPS